MRACRAPEACLSQGCSEALIRIMRAFTNAVTAMISSRAGTDHPSRQISMETICAAPANTTPLMAKAWSHVMPFWAARDPNAAAKTMMLGGKGRVMRAPWRHPSRVRAARSSEIDMEMGLQQQAAGCRPTTAFAPALRYGGG